MSVYTVENGSITAFSALKRKRSAPQLVVVAPSGSGKSTLIYLLLNHRLIPYMRIGIGEKSQTTIIPCDFCFDTRINRESQFAIQVILKDYAAKEIHMVVLTVLMDLFAKNDCDAEETIEAFDENVFMKILEPEKSNYHLLHIIDDISVEKLKDALFSILEYMSENDFVTKVKKRRDELKSKKVKLPEVREMIFEEMYEAMPEDIKSGYIEWLYKIGKIIACKFENAVGKEIFSERIVQYNLDGEDDGTNVLEALFDPFAPYSLLIDHISIACKPRQELIDIARNKEPDLPFRFCIRDTMGLTQNGMDLSNAKDALEVALNCKADAILFLLSLEERDDVLMECCKALLEKKDELYKKSHINVSMYVLFTKADRKVENLINKCNTGDLYIDEQTYLDNIKSVLADIEETVDKYRTILPQEDIGWISMRYVKDSYVLKSLEEDGRKRNFKPEGLFERIVDYSMNTLRRTLPYGINKPFFVTAIDPDKPAIQVNVDSDKIRDEIESIQYFLTEEKDVVNGYVIRECVPRLHGRSVYAYWSNLTVGLGHTTKASVYGNFSINMKGLLKRILSKTFSSFSVFDENRAVTFTADNIPDEALLNVVKELCANENVDAGMNPALGEKYIALQRLYEFYIDYFSDEYRYAAIIDRLAYDMSYGNPELKQKLTDIYNFTPGYDGAMRKMQDWFKDFFGSDEFTRILISELNQVMTEMVNKSFIVI